MTYRDIAGLLLLAALWGGSFLLLRIAAPVLGPVWLIELRVLIAGLVLLPLLLRQGEQTLIWPHRRSLFVVGCLNSALPFLLLAYASLALPAGFTSILNATAPLFGSAIAVVWLGERLTARRIAGLLLGFSGVLVLVWPGVLAISPQFWRSVATGLLAGLSYAIAAPYIRQRLAGVPPLVTATTSQLSAAIALLPLLPFTRPATAPPVSVWLAVITLAVFSTAIAYLLYFQLIRQIGSTRALMVTYLIPLFAMLWGALVLGETVTRSMAIGCGLILLGTAIALGSTQPKPQDTHTNLHLK